jgi:rifampin ADP-ribosylating transferase
MNSTGKDEQVGEAEWTPVTYENCSGVPGPFYHGSRYTLETGQRLVPGFGSNYERGRIANNVYFSSLMEPAVWAAELAVALAESQDSGYIYIVVPEGPFEDDPNLTNKRFPGNPTRSYRTKQPLRIVGMVDRWTGHPPEVLQAMVDGLKEKLRNGMAQIED